MLARIIEPASKLDSLRVLEGAGVAAPSYATVERRLPTYAEDEWRQRLSAACAAHAWLGPASLVLHDVSTLYFETDIRMSMTSRSNFAATRMSSWPGQSHHSCPFAHSTGMVAADRSVAGLVFLT